MNRGRIVLCGDSGPMIDNSLHKCMDNIVG